MSLSENLITAAKSGNTKEVRRLLSKGALFTKDQYGNTALHEAAWNGNSDIVKILLTGFCFVDSINNTGFTPLHLASQNGHAKIVKTLLKWKANPSLVNQHGETALHLVAKYNHANVISSFAAHKVCLDLRGKEGNTALHIAAKLGNVETAKAMLSAGAHPAIPNHSSLRPLNYAETGGYPALAKLLNTAMQKYKPKQKHHNSMSPRVSPTVASPGSPYTTSYSSFSQPDDYPCSLSQPLGESSPVHVHGIKPRVQRSKSAKTSKDVRSSANKQTSKKIVKTEKEDKLTGSLSPAPYKYFSSQDELDSSGLCSDSVERCHRSMSPAAHRQATIDQMLTEIETEYMGPGYKYKPLIDSLYVDSNDYSHPRPAKSAKAYLQSTRNGDVTQENYDALTAPGLDDEYDYPNPNNTNSSNSNNSALQRSNQSRAQSEQHSHYQSPRQTRKLPSPPASPPPTTTGKFKNHTYEPLMPKEDVDTYVYMAPLSDYPELLLEESAQQAKRSLSPKTSDSQSLLSESGSELSAGGSVGCNKSGKKVSAVRDSPIEADRKHEPNAVLEPVKGILITQTANNEAEKSQLEDYLQKELETIRQAFQIRLTQLEKRYQRQLELEKHRNILSPLLPQVHPNPSQRREQAKLKRNSWHSCVAIEQDSEIPDKKSESVFNGDLPSGSDIYEHDPSLVNELPESLRGGDQSTTTKQSKTQDDSNKPTENEFSDYEDMSAVCPVDEDSQKLIQQKVSDYRDRMLQHFKEKSEAQIVAIEQEYQSQINEVQRKCEDSASEEVVQLKGRIKNLEERLEVQTTLV